MFFSWRVCCFLDWDGQVDVNGLLEAFAAHPQIGDPASAAKKTEGSARLNFVCSSLFIQLLLFLELLYVGIVFVTKVVWSTGKGKICILLLDMCFLFFICAILYRI